MKTASLACLVLLMALVGVGGAARADDIVPPQVVQRVPAIAPADALAPGQEALVVLSVTIEADGRVGDVSVVQSGGATLDAVAEASVREWTFRPATRGDVAIAAKIKVGVQFTAPAPPRAPTPAPEPAVPPPAAPAAPAAPTPEEAAETTLEATIHGRARPRSRGSSDYVQAVGKLAEVPRKNAAELLKLAPGFLLTNEGGEGHAEQIFLRGFDAREGQDIEISVDGVPVNEAGNLHGNGYADLHFVMPELVQSLRVVEGPFDPRQGNFAVAGSAEYELGLEKRGVTAKVSAGSFGTERLAFLWGPPGESTHTFAGVELYRTDGFGQNRDAKRGTAQAQYEGRLGEDGTFRLGTSFYTTLYHSAGVIREDDFEAGAVGFYDTYDAHQGGDATRFSLNADIEVKNGDVTQHHLLYFTFSNLQLRENFTGFLEDPQEAIQALHVQRGDLLTLENTGFTFGGRGFVRKRLDVLGHPQDVELGYFARMDLVHSTQYRIANGSNHPYLLDTDLDSVLGDIGLYADVNVKPLRWLTLRGGVRADLLTFDVMNNCAVHADADSHPSQASDASCLEEENFGQHREPVQQATATGTTVMPRATLLVGPFFGFTLSGSYGIGVRSMGPVDIAPDTQTAFSSIQAGEVGVSYDARLDSVTANVRTTAFRTHVDHELAFSEIAGRNTIGSASTRTGVSASGRATGSFFDTAASVTWVQSKLDDSDLLIPYVPDLVVRLDGALFAPVPFLHALRGTLGTGVTYVGRRPLPFGQRSDTVFTIDGQASVGWGPYTVGLSVLNLLDAEYRLGEYNYASDFHLGGELPSLVPTRHFTAGQPRTFLVTLEVTL